MQNKVVDVGDLLDENGKLIEKGYATSLIKKYDRKKIKAGKLRIKEWDYYLIYNDAYGVALTVDDNSYMGLNSITFLDFEKGTELTKTFMSFMPNGKVGMPSTSKIGDVMVSTKKYTFKFENNGKERHIYAFIKNFQNGQPLEVDFILTKEPKESMVILTPFKEKKTAFYYNQKIVGLKAVGYAQIGTQKISFKNPTRAILDWGRGVWTYKNVWYWGAGCGVVKNREIGFNIGYGFGDTSNASENMIFVDGKAHKIDQVTFNIPKDKNGKEKFLESWTFTSNDGRFEMKFKPIIDRHSKSSAIIISSNQHQVFGKFSGTLILDNGERIELKDFLGFAEKVVNKW